MLLLLWWMSGHSQLTLTTSATMNTVCNGFGCNYYGPSILINEVMIRPNVCDGSIYGSEPSMPASQRQGEWIELYNPDLCKSVDISCYFLGNCSPEDGGYYGGGYEIPQGTVVPPRGFVIVRGVNAPAVPSNLLVQNGGKTVELIISSTSAVCLGGGYRLWFPNAGGWFAFYNKNGVPQDAISWNSPDNQAVSGTPCNPPGGCPFSGTLSNYNNIPANRKNYIHNNQPTQGQSIRRIPDGGNWVVNATAAATYGNCNSTCIPPPVITCVGSASVTVSGGTPPYAYHWSDGQVQTTATAVGLCGGNYCVTVTDAANNTGVACVDVPEFTPVVSLNFSGNFCSDAGLVTLTGGSPPGGTYSGPGISNNVFNPALADTGTHQIKYRYANSDSCWSADSVLVYVYPTPTAFLPPLPSVCQRAAPIPLTSGFPAGGTYAGTGVVGNIFDPAVAGVGTHQIAYILSNSYGCNDTAFRYITVSPGPTVTLAPIAGICSTAGPFVLSGGIPAGGTYSGIGVVGSTFDPAVSGPGAFLITYTYADVFNCQGTASKTIQVYMAPQVSMPALPALCSNGNPITLNGGSPASGTYTGTGVAGGIFNPVTAGPGTFPITYTYTDEHQCTDTAIRNITVNAAPVVTLANFPGYCVNGNPVTLTGGSPAGGTYSGPGISGGVFNPASTGVGTFTCTYNYVDANGCAGSATNTITVNNAPVVGFNPIPPVCVNVQYVSLTGGTPGGGTYSGSGLIGSILLPPTAGVGTHTITYTYQDANGCSGSAQQTVQIFDLPNVVMNPLGDLCLNASPVTLSGGSPAGGTYFGPGVNNNIFDPSTVGAGAYDLGYTYTDTHGCIDSAVQTVNVIPLPMVSLPEQTGVCINYDPVSLTGGSPPGGTYSGQGVNAGMFDPGVTGLGTYDIVYLYEDTNQCSNADTNLITVYPLPEVHLVTGGGTTCTGTNGSPVGLDSTQIGVQYQMFILGQTNGSPLMGTGDSLSFSNQTSPGFYTVLATDTLSGCTSMMADSVLIFLLPQPQVDMVDSVFYCDQTSIVLDAGAFQDSLTYEWQDGSTNRYFTASAPGWYWVKVGLGTCFSYDSTEVLDCSDLWVPNVFTPNGSGGNERFLPKILQGNILEYDVKVFDRWGKIVYQSGDIEEGWDGKNIKNGLTCPDGTYFFTIRYKVDAYPYEPKDRAASGSVTLLR